MTLGAEVVKPSCGVPRCGVATSLQMCFSKVVQEERDRLSDFTFTFHFHALEKEMATHSTVLAWRIPGTGEPGGLPSMDEVS